MSEKPETWNHTTAAEYIGITPGTMRVWCSKRKIPFIKINGRVRFRQVDLDKFLDDGLIQPLNVGEATIEKK
jgi:excisionase family DNA binding protein